MLNQILANLQFNSSYRYKLHSFILKTTKERLIRGLGVMFIVAALLIQIFAVIAPNKSGATASENDLIPGGVTSQQQIVDDCNSNYHYVGLLYGLYGVSCQDIASGHVISLNSTSTAYGGALWGVGHEPYNLPDEQAVPIFGGATIYWRPLHDWDTNGSSTYTAVQVTNSQGLTYFILFTCGNLISVGFPTPVPPPATPTPPSPPTTPTPPTPPPPCIYNNSLPASSPLCKPPAPPITPPTTPTPCTFNSLLPADSPNCKPCPSSTNQSDTASCLTFSKNASNITQNLANAEQATANAGDVIRYTLTVANTGKVDQPDFVIQDNLGDVLQYANSGDLNGGAIDSNQTLSWPAVTIPAGGVVQKTFTMMVKNPVPDTAPAADDPEGFNDVMTNTYNNTINIKVQPTPVQTVIQTISPTTMAPATLVNTGPGTSIIVFFVIATLAGFIYSTRRLQIKEAKIAMALSVQEGQA